MITNQIAGNGRLAHRVSVGLAALLCTVLLAACGPSREQLNAFSDAQIRAAKAERELELQKEATAKAARQVAARRQVAELAKQVVRTGGMVHPSGCATEPAALPRLEHYREFGPMMMDLYPYNCRAQVSLYGIELRAAAKKAVATARAQALANRHAAAQAKAKRLATANAKASQKLVAAKAPAKTKN